MAQRTRNHVIEDKSRQALSAILPDNWVIRDKDKDYGIDCEVEIFDHHGIPTGLVFWVQLKATESKREYDVKNIFFKAEKIYQFQNYKIPVVIVRYSVTDNLLYYNWANDITCQTIINERIKVQFSEEKILNQTTVIRFQNYLSRFHEVQRGSFSLPIKIFISKNALDSQKIPSSSVQFFKKIIQNNNSYFNLVRTEDDSTLQVLVGNQKMYISLSNTQSSSVAYESLSLEKENIDYYNDLLLACVSIILYKSNRSDLADAIFFENSLINIIKIRQDYLFQFLPHLLLGKYYEETLNELDEMFDITSDNSIQSISLIILQASRKLSPDRKDVCEKFMLKQIEYAKVKNYDLGRAIANYNLGNFHRSLGNFQKSLHYYVEAKNYNTEYLKKGYFFFDVAGVLFELNKYLFATRFYQKALDLKAENVLTKALLADAFLYLGEYELSLKWFDEFLIEQKKNDEIDKEEWYLKYFCINSLLLNDYPKQQKRNPVASLQFLSEGKIKDAIESDMLFSEAWFENGKKSHQEGAELESFVSFIMSALFNKENLLSWIYATITGFIDEDRESLHVFEIMKLAYHYHGENYVDALYEFSSDNLPDVEEALMKVVEIIIKDSKKEEFTIRIFENETDYEIINLVR